MVKNPELQIPIEDANHRLETLSAESRLEWAIQEFDSKFALTTSFGIQSSVLLHMIHLIDRNQIAKIIWIDTGYLPPETYKYAEQLTNKLKIDIKAVQSDFSPARMEALYGKLWETNSIEDLEKYNSIRKVQPLEKALTDLEIQCWGSGVRRGQTGHRQSMSFLEPFNKRLSIRPILDWSKKDIFYYMQENNLPQHPLFEKGYSSIGDWHSSGPDNAKAIGRKTRFGGLKEECGIHIAGSIEKGENN